MTELPFKKIDSENWLQADPVSSRLAKGKDANGWVHYKGEDYLAEVLEPTLSSNVPTDVQQLFEMTKGIYAYGYFFYPLFTVGMENALRTAEAALAHLCKRLDAPKGVKSFQRRIDWLKNQGVLNPEETIKWEQFKYLRNTWSHPKHPMFIPHTMTIKSIEAIAEAINALFKTV